ncbi:helix-turn-helix transcriptional regulator [Actinoallomurus oryzae]|uniref:Helix-turn-helix transcriptional regulator n=1 Tax=Actinoallomurus oryzae TaxID=502180 RepID=A0ABP8QZ11_9ACTN
MDDVRHSPTVRRRRLARELRRLREAAGLTADEATRRLEWATGKVNKLERAQAVRPRVTDIRAMLDVYGVTEDTQREALLDLTREARRRGWWTAYGPLTDTYTEFESEARMISTFELSVIPGLLQTPAYARALQRGWLVRDEEIDRLVELRMRRQKLLTYDDPPRLWAIIDESAVKRSFGSEETKREQLQRLIDTARLDHVDIQILPTAAGFHPGLSGSFVILDYDQDPSLVYREISPSSVYLEGPDQVAERRRVFEHLSALALGPEESIARLRRLAERS